MKISNIIQNFKTTTKTTPRGATEKMFKSNNISFGTFQGAVSEGSSLINRIGNLGKNIWEVAKKHKLLSIGAVAVAGILGFGAIAKLKAKKAEGIDTQA